MKRLCLVTAVASAAALSFGQSFTDSFENADYTGNLPAGGTINSVVSWTAFNNSVPVGTTGWFDGNVSVFTAFDGAKYIGTNFNNTSGTSTIDNWLFSPVRTFNNGDTISFFTRTVTTPAFPDRLYLRLGTNGVSTAVGDYGTILVSVNPNLTTQDYPNTWTQFSATLSGLPGAGVSGRFAFNYNVPNGGPTGANSDYIGIDQAVYTAAPVPEPASMAALGLGALALLRRRRAR